MSRFSLLALAPVLLTLAACPGDDTGNDDAATPGTGAAASTSGDEPPGTTTAVDDASTSSPATTINPGSTGPDPDDTGPEDTGPPVGDCSTALLCEDFEAYPAGQGPAGPWTVDTAQASVVIDETRAVSGARSVRITTEDGEGTYRRAFMSVTGAPVFPLDGNVMYGRMMIWLTAAPEGSVHWTNIQGEGDVEGMGFRGLSRYGGQHDGRLMANYETSGISTDCWQHSDTTIPVGQWACFEWRFNGPNDEMNFWLDGAPLDDLTVIGMGEGCGGNDAGGYWYSPIYDTLRLGWEHYQATSGKELWIDDVAVDVERIGCPAAP
jgi:hypothetical protein